MKILTTITVAVLSLGFVVEVERLILTGKATPRGKRRGRRGAIKGEHPWSKMKVILHPATYPTYRRCLSHWRILMVSFKFQFIYLCNLRNWLLGVRVHTKLRVL